MYCVSNAFHFSYFLFLFFCLVFTVFLSTLSLFLATLEAARYLHNDFLTKIIRARPCFFDVTPIGRLINRFSNDVNEIDNDFPATLRAFASCVFSVSIPTKQENLTLVNHISLFLFSFSPLIFLWWERGTLNYVHNYNEIFMFQMHFIFRHFLVSQSIIADLFPHLHTLLLNLNQAFCEALVISNYFSMIFESDFQHLGFYFSHFRSFFEPYL